MRTLTARGNRGKAMNIAAGATVNKPGTLGLRRGDRHGRFRGLDSNLSDQFTLRRRGWREDQFLLRNWCGRRSRIEAVCRGSLLGPDVDNSANGDRRENDDGPNLREAQTEVIVERGDQECR